MKLAVGSAWASPFVWTKFTEAALNVRSPAGFDVRWIMGGGWCPARRHTDLCEKALSWGADLICFFGADQIPPPDLLERLVARFREGYEVIGALVPARGYFGWNEGMRPFQPMAWRFRAQQPVNGRINVRAYKGQAVTPDLIEVIDPKDGDVQRVDFIGSGCLLIHRDHLLSLTRPWFYETVDPITYNRHASMDCRFAWRLREEAGANVWVDTTIKIKHLHGFEIDETFQHRFMDYADGSGPGDLCKYQPLIPQTAEA